MDNLINTQEIIDSFNDIENDLINITKLKEIPEESLVKLNDIKFAINKIEVLFKEQLGISDFQGLIDEILQEKEIDE